MINYTKQKMLNKSKTVGTFFGLGTANAIEGLGYSGLDYVIIDTEHGPFTEESTIEFIRAAKLSKLTPFVRIKEVSRAAVLKMLDIGAEGIIIPDIETVEQVKLIVKYGKYAPLGERGFSFGRVSGYGFEDFTSPLENYFEKSNNETMIIPQCETLGALNNIEEIVNVAGVDAVFIGPYDLSIDMGIPGQFDSIEFKEALLRIIQACKQAGKPAMIFSSTTDGAVANFDMGFDSVAVNTDIGVLVEGYLNLTNLLKSKKY